MILNKDNKINRAAFDEFPGLLSNSLWENSSGNYTVFGRYNIVKDQIGYRVHCALTDVGMFYSTRSALSWCIADKFKKYNLARDLIQLDTSLYHITADIATRAAIGNRVKDSDTYEIILTKLETKILKKKEIENRLVKCVNLAKYCQQQGFDNETARISRTVTDKTNR